MGLYPDNRDANRRPHQPVEVPVPLHLFRKALGLSLTELVGLMPPHADGRRWSAAAVSRAEHGNRGASSELIAAIAAGIANYWNCDSGHGVGHPVEHPAGDATDGATS